ncbi:hydroxyacid dehydrogenase [Candidatus Woesearchaeota archaeon]|nr:hydroxyacid dehydrogenase [Candidatus Woesearchaeota archaeon]
MAKIIFYEIEDWEKDYIRERLQGHDLVFYTENLDKDNLKTAKDADALGVFIYSEITPEVINSIPNLKLIATMSTGYDHIDLNEAKNKKVTVCNVPSYGENTVAEHTFGLILSISKKIIESVERTKKGNFCLDGLRGFDLKGKTIGVVGTGKIGRHVIRMAKGFEMNIIAYDPYPNNEFAQEMGFRYVSLDELLSNSDIITLHAPYMESTHHMINMDNINKIKRGAVLINTARGGLVETNALIEALRQGIISAAGLDVLEEEGFIREEKELLSNVFQTKCDYKTILQEHMLMSQDNVIVTPHNAFNTKEALQRIIDVTIENIKKFFEGNSQNVVNK